MNIRDILDFFRHEPDKPHRVVALADPEPASQHGPYDPLRGGYFQIRLNEMYLTDQRRWHQEVMPAAFLYTDFAYAAGRVQRPFFVSNALLPEMPLGPEPASLRVRFANTSVLGPVPYGGGDVQLFVGLFQTAVADWRRIAFQMLEKIFSTLGPNPLSPYAEKIDTLSRDLLALLGLGDVQCLLAHQRAIGEHQFPAPGYLAYLRYSKNPVPDEQLQVHEGRLKRKVDGELRQFDETDYCLVRIQYLPSRNDYLSMGFHALYLEARQKAVGGNTEEAQALMLACARQILASPDLSEGDKSDLIPYFQSKVHESGKLLKPAATPHGAMRAGTEEMIGTMRQRARATRVFDLDEILSVYNELSRVATELAQQDMSGEVDEENLATYLQRVRSQPAHFIAPARQVQALELGSIVETPPHGGGG